MTATVVRGARPRGAGAPEVAIERIDVSAYTLPTDAPESDGTAEWDATTMVLVEAQAGGQTGLGYTYGDVSSGAVIDSVLRDVVSGRDAMSVGGKQQIVREPDGIHLNETGSQLLSEIVTADLKQSFTY